MNTDAPVDFKLGFRSSAERIVTERAERTKLAGRISPFGVSFLDQLLAGIFPNDLIVLGARTGVGKTQLSSIIARANVAIGKRVHYFALEAEPSEIERRIKYQLITDRLYQTTVSTEQKKRINYVDWYAGKLDGVIGLLDGEADRKIAEGYRTLFTYYKTGGFNVDDLSRTMLAIQDQTDLIILDHLHYVDTDDANENRGVKEIVKVIRDVSISMGKPVVVVAHLRKADRGSKALVPDLDDFHGSSDITKIATKCIMLARAKDRPSQYPWLYPTYMQCPKFRMEGSRTHYTAVIDFNARLGTYEHDYSLGRLSFDGQQWELVKNDQVPHWAKENA